MEGTNIKSVPDFKKWCDARADECGMKLSGRKINAVARTNIKDEDSNVPYFGYISADEPTGGPYSDFCMVFFPLEQTDNCQYYIMAFAVGSEGFKNDYELANQQGIRRKFIKILPTNLGCSKLDFTDIEHPIDFEQIQESLNKDISISAKLSKYESVLQAVCLIDVCKDDDLILVKSWIAQYAEIRKWASTQKQRATVGEYISQGRLLVKNCELDTNAEDTLTELLFNRQFVVVQGAPGVGKTYLAEKIGESFDTVFFTQFHAETTYSDFIEGIIPVTDKGGEFKYINKPGILAECLRYASSEENRDKKVLLIIDEINRANLSNVLGPTFYLFENGRSSAYEHGVELKSINQTYNCIPKNLYVLATMNTADRSIAVVDFALRRRFAWYNVEPSFFGDSSTIGFNEFNEISRIFETYATDAELNLQPGGAYFIANDNNELLSKIEYELMPLIKEYLDEGFLLNAKEAFCNFFYRKIGKELYK